MQSGKRQTSQRRSAKDGNPLLDLPTRKKKVLKYRTSPSKLHPRCNPTPPIIPEVGLDHPLCLILTRPVLETGARWLRRVLLTTARSSPLLPHPLMKTHGGQQSVGNWKDFQNGLLPPMNLYSETLTPDAPHNHLLSPLSPDRVFLRGLTLLIIRRRLQTPQSTHLRSRPFSHTKRFPHRYALLPSRCSDHRLKWSGTSCRHHHQGRPSLPN
jgi:hypothetical protein